MKHEFIKKLEACKVELCPHCNRCASVNSGENETTVVETRSNSDLYNKEAEQYYFYFLSNKAS